MKICIFLSLIISQRRYIINNFEIVKKISLKKKRIAIKKNIWIVENLKEQKLKS